MPDDERITPNPLRTLGADERPADEMPPPPPTEPLALLKAEFERALEMKARLAAESPEKVATSARTLVASLEGMSRFALKMKLVTPAQSRELFARAKDLGLYDGWGG